MGMLFQVGLGLHTLFAVLGIGQVLALVVLASQLRTGGDRQSTVLGLMSRLARIIGISLGFMLLTGIAVMIPTRGAQASGLWFRIAFVLFIVLGALNGILQGTLRRAGGTASDARTQALGRLPMLAWTEVAVASIIVLLMATKPF